LSFRSSKAFRKLLERTWGGRPAREFKKGEIICREGEQGSTAFYILKGKVDIYHHTLVSQIQKEAEKKLVQPDEKHFGL
jgi:CRP-like cAMP-binding protein